MQLHRGHEYTVGGSSARAGIISTLARLMNEYRWLQLDDHQSIRTRWQRRLSLWCCLWYLYTEYGICKLDPSIIQSAAARRSVITAIVVGVHRSTRNHNHQPTWQANETRRETNVLAIQCMSDLEVKTSERPGYHGVLFWSSCAIQTSPKDCSADSWRNSFFGKHEHGALWLLMWGVLEKHLLTCSRDVQTTGGRGIFSPRKYVHVLYQTSEVAVLIFIRHTTSECSVVMFSVPFCPCVSVSVFLSVCLSVCLSVMLQFVEVLT